MRRMLGLPHLSCIEEQQLPAQVVQMLRQMGQQIEQQAREIERKDREISDKSREIAWRDARLEKISLELARLKRWKFDAKTEAMTAQQRALFAETLIEDEASLQAQLAALQAELQAKLPQPPAAPKDAPRRPRRQALPEHLQRVEHRHEPADTHCPNAGCGAPMHPVSSPLARTGPARRR